MATGQLDEMLRALRRTSRVPFPRDVRLTRLLDALFDYAIANPELYRALFTDAVAPLDARPAPPAFGARALIAAEVAELLAGSPGAATAPEVVAASAGIVGFALANIGLCLAGGLEPEHACQLTCAYCTARLPA